MQGIRSKANVINLFLTIFSCMAYYKDSKELCSQALGPWVMKTAGQVFVNPHKNENLNKFYLFFIFFDISMLVSIGLIASIKKNLFSFWKKKRFNKTNFKTAVVHGYLGNKW